MLPSSVVMIHDVKQQARLFVIDRSKKKKKKRKAWELPDVLMMLQTCRENVCYVVKAAEPTNTLPPSSVPQAIHVGVVPTLRLASQRSLSDAGNALLLLLMLLHSRLRLQDARVRKID